MSTSTYMPPIGEPPIPGFVTKVRRLPGHYVDKAEPVIDISIAENILSICAPFSGKIMRAREGGDIVEPGEHLIEVTEVGTPTWELFVAYRRSDSAGHTGRVGDHLVTAFGAGQVFKDIEALPPGRDFVAVVRERLQLAVAMIVIIGPEWICPRLNEPDDLHREEIRTALQRDILVIPVRVNSALLPSRDDLPEDIRPLVRKQALEVTDERWHFDMGRVAQAILPSLLASPRRRAFVRQVPPLRPGPYVQWIEDNPPLERRD